MVKRRNIWLALLDVLLNTVTVAFAVALLMALIARWISSETTTFFAFFALGAPFLYLANFITLSLWVIRWKRIALLPAFVLLFGVANIGDFFQLKWTKNYKETVQSADITIISYNVHNFRLFNNDSHSTLDGICRELNKTGADVIFLQEYSIVDSAELARFDESMSAYPYRAYQYNVTNEFTHHGQIILSRHPLSGSRTIHFEQSDNSAMIVNLYHPIDTLRLIGCHLQTTAFNAVSNSRGLRSVIADKNRDSLAGSAIAALAQNFRLRAAQADSVRQLADESIFPVVVAGDFNSPPLTYTYSTVCDGLSDAFCDAGSGYGYTYKPIKGLFRIDYVLFDGDSYEAVDYQSPNWSYSDHNAVIVRLKKQK